MLIGNKVTVFGGTGFVGKAVINELSKAGYEVNVVVRRPERYREMMLFPQASLFTLDTFDNTDALIEAIQGSDIVVNLTVDRSTGTEMIAKKALASVAQKIKSASEKSAVKRVLSLSQIGASTDIHAKKWLGTVGEVDNQMHTVANAKTTIFKAGLLIGAGDQSTQRYINQLNKFEILPVPKAAKVVQPLAIKDFAKAVVGSIKNSDTFGTKLDVVGEERLSLKELAKLTAELMQKQPLVFGMCSMNARIMATLGGLAPIASSDKALLDMMHADLVSDADFSTQFGFVPVSLEKTIAAYATPSQMRGRYNYYRKEANRDAQDLMS